MRAEAEQTEAWVESYLFRRATELGALCVKVKQVRGMPDRIVIWFEGVIDFIELKRPKGGTYGPLQLRMHDKIRDRGHNVFIICTRFQVDAYLRLRRDAWSPYQRRNA